VEGALAPDPDARPEGVVRELPGWRRRERPPSWKDEVKERVRKRRRQRHEASLPLFPDPPGDEGAVDVPSKPPTPEARKPPAEAVAPVFYEDEAAFEPASAPAVAAPAAPPTAPSALPEPSPPVAEPRPAVFDRDFEAESIPEQGVPAEPRGVTLSELKAQLREVRLDFVEPDDVEFAEPDEEPEPMDEGSGQPWTFSLPSPPLSGPLERPAQAMERVQAAVLDLGLLLALWLVVAYFASRAARVPMDALVASWSYMVSYLVFLGLAYATYFTAATGQTLGKQALGLRVVGPGGRPPSAWRALGRAVLGLVGLVAGFAGFIPLLWDPARRGLHDRLLDTRVVRR
jgi:uncharacterized RDD family membrane protein YckC